MKIKSLGKKLLSVGMALAVFAGVVCPAADFSYATTPAPGIEAQGGIVIDYMSGQVLYSKNEDAQYEPASMTKIMTCILALENLELTDIVTIDSETPFTGGSRIYLLEDEQITVQNLLYALMLESANDSAVALAKKIAGSVPAFADMMNAKAKELGCTGTHFVNPNGLHEEGHLSTCHDMALIAQYAMHNEQFRELCTTYKYTIPATNKQPERYLYNTNRLLYDNVNKVVVNGVKRGCKYEGCTGIKTGYTPDAGGCLTAGAKNGETEIISVVMASTDMGRFADTIALFDWSFANYHSAKAAEKGQVIGTVPVKGGAVRKVGLITADEAYVLLPAEASTAIITTKAEMEKSIKAPFDKGAKVGTLDIYAGDKKVGSVPIITTDGVAKGTILSYLGIENAKAYIIMGVGGAVLAIVLGFVIYISILKAKRRKAKRLRRQQRALEIARQRAERQADQQMRDWFFN